MAKICWLIIILALISAICRTLPCTEAVGGRAGLGHVLKPHSQLVATPGHVLPGLNCSKHLFNSGFKPCGDLNTKCSKPITKLITCLQYLEGQIPRPDPICCAAVQDVATNNPECFCQVTFFPPDGISLVFQQAMPVYCNATSIADGKLCDACPELLGAVPGSTHSCLQPGNIYTHHKPALHSYLIKSDISTLMQSHHYISKIETMPTRHRVQISTGKKILNPKAPGTKHSCLQTR